MKKRTKKLLLLALLGGCASMRDNPASVLDAYLVAHGMATSYVERPDANPAVVQQLVLLDSRAAEAMRSQDGSANDAVAALTTLAARQSAPEEATHPTP